MEITHLDKKGNAWMVDVSSKKMTAREAVAAGRVYMKNETLLKIMEGSVPKGDVFATARIAGIMAAKRTQELIPLCHNVPLDFASVELVCNIGASSVDILATVCCTWKTGVEMEALTAVSAAALTIYDMCKAVDKGMVLGDIKLVKKTGGKTEVGNQRKELY
ncbi:MAG: cyclic pyranopterin monophosphate synthase MoaC [Clostridiales bacterium]|nr:cyclic pyranopterin monophosphate synthase MoaC [Clostridiales bacterium]